MLKYLIISTRPRQWYKNSLLFVCIIFSGAFLQASPWSTLILAFVYFCMLTGSEYIINDVLDRERDREHPVKSKRPIASGKLKTQYALLFSFTLIVLALLGAYFTINIGFLLISVSHIVLVLLYTFLLKHLVIADVMTISLGFVVRAVAGCLAIDVFISPWLIICTFLLAMFLALEKRWHELATLSDNAVVHRPNLAEYSARMLEMFIGITTGATIVSYLVYTTLAENSAMIITSPFAIYGLFRYGYLVHQKKLGGDTEVLFRDKALAVNLIIWISLVVAIMLYGVLS